MHIRPSLDQSAFLLCAEAGPCQEYRVNPVRRVDDPKSDKRIVIQVTRLVIRIEFAIKLG